MQHAAATTCELCHGQFTKKVKKTKYHCHLSGLYIDPYCNTCNLKLKYKNGSNTDPTDEKKNKASKRKQTKFFNGTFEKIIKKAEDVARDNDDIDATGYIMTEDSYMIPVNFHNLNGYDSHLIMQYGTREYASNSIDVIPTTSDKFLNSKSAIFASSTVYNFSASPSTRSSKVWLQDGRYKFSHIARHYPDSDLVFAKGNYPYEYMDGRETFFLTELYPIDAFYGSLSEETITLEEYERAQKVWREFKIKNMQQYHDLYLNHDVLLLADVFENFRQTCILNYGLDSCTLLYFTSINIR